MEYFPVLLSFCCACILLHVDADTRATASLRPRDSKPAPVPKSTTGPKKIPQVPNGFSFKSEVVQPALKKIRTTEQWFNSESKVSRVDVKPLGKALGINVLWRDDFGTNPLSVVHDFNTGHAYVMDKVVGNCTITPIELGLDDAKDPDPLKHHWVKMLNASAFFDLSDNFVYQGTEQVGEGAARLRWDRGHPCRRQLARWRRIIPPATSIDFHSHHYEQQRKRAACNKLYPHRETDVNTPHITV